MKITNLPILKQSQLPQQSRLTAYNAANGNGRVMNETHQRYNPTVPINVTKTMANMAGSTNETNVERNLTRSNTFVCDTSDAGQTKLLAVTHNVHASQTVDVTLGQPVVKERTKRSLSPIPIDATNAAKRKSVQSIVRERKLSSGPLLVSTPHHHHSNAETKFPYFGAKVNATKHRHSLEMPTFSLDTTVAQFESTRRSNVCAADTVQLHEDATKSTKQRNHMADLMHTMVVHAADECGASSSKAQHTFNMDGNMHDVTITKSNALNSAKNDDVDLTKTILGK